MSKIYTRTGDNGQTSLVGGARVSKTHPRLEAYGTIDELSSHLGLLSAMLPQKEHHRLFLLKIQHSLFVVSTLLATEDDCGFRPAPLDVSAISNLEQEIDTLQSQLPPLRAFIIPGGCKEASQAHVCRTVCRRAERRVLALNEHTPVSKDVICYLNRLSDYLFVLARYLNIHSATPEIEHR